jgi:hypothetical protein
MAHNHSVERTGASRFAQSMFLALWGLAPAAHAGRWLALRPVTIPRGNGQM